MFLLPGKTPPTVKVDSTGWWIVWERFCRWRTGLLLPGWATWRIFWGHARKMCYSEDLNSLHQVNFPLTLRMQDWQWSCSWKTVCKMWRRSVEHACWRFATHMAVHVCNCHAALGTYHDVCMKKRRQRHTDTMQYGHINTESMAPKESPMKVRWCHDGQRIRLETSQPWKRVSVRMIIQRLSIFLPSTTSLHLQNYRFFMHMRQYAQAPAHMICRWIGITSSSWKSWGLLRLAGLAFLNAEKFRESLVNLLLQVEWGALKGPSLGARKGDGKDSFDAPDEEKIDGIVPELTERQQDWREDWGLDWFC